MLTITAALTIWALVSVLIIVAVHRATSKRYPSQPGTDTGDLVFDIEDYQWQDVA